MREFLAKEPRGCALEAADDFGDGTGRITFDKQMHVIRHHLHLVDGDVMMQRHFFDELLEPGIDRRRQDRPSELWAPDHVVFEAENSPGIACISGSRLGHEAYISVAYLIVKRQKKGRAFPRQLKQTVPCAQDLWVNPQSVR